MPPIDRGQGRRGGTRGDEGRAERLAAKLRENLKRRKDRERAFGASDGAESDAAESDAAGEPPVRKER